MTVRTHRTDEFWNRQDDEEVGRVFNPIVVLVTAILVILALFWIVAEAEDAPRADAAAPQQVVAQAVINSVKIGSTGDRVREVQYVLRSFGYTLDVDGQFGPQTDKVVRHFQAVSGLDPDGVVGPLTSGALKIAAPGVATSGAVRGEQTQVQPAPASAPALTGCDEMSAIRQAVGLPENMDAIGYRESRCRNDVVSSTGCCVGYFQIHTGNFTAPGYRDGIRACGVTSRSDILGNSDEQKQKNACVAKVLYDVSGMSPWRL